MTEAEWLAGGDAAAGAMLRAVEGEVWGRELRLLACACCRAAWGQLADPRSRDAVGVAERFADGRATPDELAEAERAASAAYFALANDSRLPPPPARTYEQWGELLQAADAAASAAGDPVEWAGVGDLLTAGLVREVFGNPFRPAAADPAWLTASVVGLAEAAYADPGAGLLPILADALEEAGCGDAEVLDHCRGPGPHYKGCWAVDLLLGKN